MKTKTIGELLREQRQRHKMSIDALACETRIRAEFLVALEENRFADLPAAAYVRGYIRSLAQTFGFDHQPVVSLLRRDFKESAQGKLVPREFLRPMIKQRSFWAPVSMTLAAAAVFACLAVGYIGYQWVVLQQPPDLTLNEPAEGAQVSAEVLLSGSTRPDAIVAVNDEVVGMNADGSFRYTLRLNREGVTTIVVQASDRLGRKRTVQRTVNVRF